MKNRYAIYKNVVLLLGVLLGVTPAFAQNLCADQEKVVFSFQGKNSKKWMSLCKESGSEYLVYRFGTRTKIEFTFPAVLDGHSWSKFDFVGRRRGGGKSNAAFGDYSLSFASGNVEYVVFQEWSAEDDTYTIGINIRAADKKSVTLLGSPKTQQGSLVLLESENKHIRNAAEDP